MFTFFSLFNTKNNYKDGKYRRYSCQQKNDFIHSLGKDKIIAIGNGANDALMLKNAALGIALIQKEGACSNTLFSADIVCTSIIDALELIKNPLRIAATLRI